MKFRELAMSNADFDAWLKQVKSAPEALSMDVYAGVARPSEKVAVRYFSTVDPKLFKNIVAKYNNGRFDVNGENCVTKG
jgi:cytochrome o ubiquinol oxidase subunit 2